MFNRLSNLSNRAVLGILIAVALASSGLSLVVNILNNVDTSPAWWVSWLQNFSTEMFGAFLTFVLIELIVGGREKRWEQERALQRESERVEFERQEEKKRLIRRMDSSNNQEAIRAVEELRSHGWLEDGTLIEASLAEANLREADLGNAQLQKSDMDDSDLNRATLRFANLQEVSLRRANLEEADLMFAKLKGTDLTEANLRDIRLYEVSCDKSTILPDGTHWTTDTDIYRFTDPTHPQFWRSDKLASPAYRGKGGE